MKSWVEATYDRARAETPDTQLLVLAFQHDGAALGAVRTASPEDERILRDYELYSPRSSDIDDDLPVLGTKVWKSSGRVIVSCWDDGCKEREFNPPEGCESIDLENIDVAKMHAHWCIEMFLLLGILKEVSQEAA